MAEKAALTRLRREYAIIQQSPKIPHIVARPSETNILVWHFVLHDLPAEAPYRGGVYEGKLVFPREYPLKPPAIYMLTPSGRFDINTRLCLSMSDFHPESWNPSWRIESILVGLVSFMLDPSEPRTTGGMHTSEGKRRDYARASFAFNTARPEFRQLFPEFCDECKRSGDGCFSLAADATSAEASETTGTTDQAEARGQQVQAQDREPPKQNLPRLLLVFSGIVLLVSLVGSSLRWQRP
mmetsp:Transcript_67456/g.158239  ORF Transcript_67456/g.158239 Transcript_67456/m.158239 type:complete len:239 (-) Transcript_67456:120-836(-)